MMIRRKHKAVSILTCLAAPAVVGVMLFAGAAPASAAVTLDSDVISSPHLAGAAASNFVLDASGKVWFVASPGAAATPVTGPGASKTFVTISGSGDMGDGGAGAIANDGTVWLIDSRGVTSQVTGVDGSTTISSAGNGLFGLDANGAAWMVKQGGGAARYVDAPASAKRFTSLSASGNYSGSGAAVAIATDGTVWTFDRNWNTWQMNKEQGTVAVASAGNRFFGIGANGQLWIGTSYVDPNSTRPVTGGAQSKTFTAVSAKGDDAGGGAVALASDGTVWALNSDGVSTQVTGVDNSTKISSGSAVLYGIDANGRGWCAPTSGGAAKPFSGDAASKTYTEVSAAGRRDNPGQGSAIALATDGSLVTVNANCESVPVAGVSVTPTPAQPGAVSDIAVSGPDAKNMYTLEGTAAPGATVTVTDKNGTVIGTAQADADGFWTSPVPAGTATPVSIVQTVNGVASDPVEFAFDSKPGVVAKPGAVSDVTVDGPDASGDYTLAGVADPAGEVTVRDADGAIVGTAIPAADGSWSVVVPQGTKTPLTITQTVNGQTSDPVTYNEAPLPVVSAGVGATALASALGGGLLWNARRRRVS